MELAKRVVAKGMQVAPFSDHCPPGTALDQLNGKCYQKIYDPGALCGYSPMMSSNLYQWNRETQTCVPTGNSLDDPFFLFNVQGAWGAFSSWWTSTRMESIIPFDIEAYNGPAIYASDLNDDGAPMGAGFFKPSSRENISTAFLHLTTDAPYSVEAELRAFIRRYPGTLPNDGYDYLVRPAPGGAPMIGAYITAQLTQLADRGLTAFCLFMETPGYNAPGYLLEYIEEFNTYMRKSPNISIATYWMRNPMSTKFTPGNALVLKGWSRESGLPQPMCSGSDGLSYQLSSLSPTSPWIEFTVSPNNPDGKLRNCSVPSYRCQVDAAYNFAIYYRRANMSSRLHYPTGSDGRPASHVYYSFTKYFGTASARWGFAASQDSDLWLRIAKMHQPWRTVFFDSSVANWLLMASAVKEFARGPESSFDMDVSSKMIMYDMLMHKYIPDSCECLELSNRPSSGKGVLGGYYWIKMKDACATLPEQEGYAPNMYIHLGEYFRIAPHLIIRTRNPLINDAAKLFDPASATRPNSVWHKWSHTRSVSRQVSIGIEPWDRGSSAGKMRSWARFTRLHFMNSDDAYVRAYMKRVGHVCEVDAPRGFLSPVQLAKLNPSIVVDENVNSGFATAEYAMVA